MLKDCGADYVILGHSEWRNVFGETNQVINQNQLFKILLIQVVKTN